MFHRKAAQTPPLCDRCDAAMECVPRSLVPTVLERDRFSVKWRCPMCLRHAVVWAS